MAKKSLNSVLAGINPYSGGHIDSNLVQSDYIIGGFYLHELKYIYWAAKLKKERTGTFK